jgi:hypothetical protein
MKAEMLPLDGMVNSMKSTIGEIEDRIFSVELYAGFKEDLVQVLDGEPAGYSEPVHIMQRRMYMDEESLIDYDTGGMNFERIEDFDAWLKKPHNLEKILPHPRTVVAFRVRRKDKDYRDYDLMVRMMFCREDKATFLYFRNGDQLWRLNTSTEFPDRLFGDDDLDLSEPLWAYHWLGDIRRVLTEREYMDRLEKHLAAVKKKKKFDERHPDFSSWRPNDGQDRDEWKALKEEHRGITSDIDSEITDRRHYVKFTPDTVWFDDIKSHVDKEIKDRNKLVMILQGIFDRSPVFSPHPPIELWTQEGFESSIRLVHDDSKALQPSEEPPSFEEYWERCNESLKTGSVVMGVQEHWREEMVRRYDNHNSKWGAKDSYDKLPWNDSGPGDIVEVEHYHPRIKKCRFKWLRRKADWSDDDYATSTLTLEQEKVFNLDGYKPGDYKIFLADHRTRENYLEWAKYLITAELYHAGEIEPNKPNELPR